MEGKQTRSRPLLDKRTSYYHHRLQNRPPNVPNYDASAIELMLNLFFTYDVVEGQIARGLAAHGLSPASFNVLMLLRGTDGFPLSELGELLLTSRANVTGLVDGLVQKDLVSREVDTNDRRSRIARLTPRGEALIQEILPGHYAKVGRMVAGLSVADRKQLSALLQKMRDGAVGPPVHASQPTRLEAQARKA